jgi:ankyrin repeat protein
MSIIINGILILLLIFLIFLYIMRKLNPYRQSPLDIEFINSIGKGDYENTKRLLENGANPEALGKNGVSALTGAAIGQYADIVDLLIAEGVDVNRGGVDKTKKVYRLAPLHFAVGKGNFKITRALVDAGANLDIPNPDGVTPLMLAMVTGQEKIVKFLIEKGANLEVKNKLGSTVLMTVCSEGYIEDEVRCRLAKLLLDKGADVNTRDNEQSTPLMAAALDGYTKVVRLLIDYGADADAKDDHNMNASDYARKYKQSEILSILLEHQSRSS